MVDPGDPEIDLYNLKEAFEADGTMINSGTFNGMNSRKAIKDITAYLEEKGSGKPLSITGLGIGLFQGSATGERRFRCFTVKMWLGAGKD